MTKTNEFIRSYAENEEKIDKLSVEIMFLQGDDNVERNGLYKMTNLLPFLKKENNILGYKNLFGTIELTREDVDSMIEIRIKKQEALIEIRKQLDSMVKGESK